MVESLRLTIENNRDVMMQELTSFSGVQGAPSRMALSTACRISAPTASNSVELANFLLKKALVVTVPGKEFGMEGHLRLSYAGTVKDVTEGIARIQLGARSQPRRARSTSATGRW